MPKRGSKIPSLDERTSGILLHLTSLPSPYGIGDMGSSAYQFIDFLESASQKWWQMLPIGPAGLGNSPYQAFSAFAGNPLLISPEELQKDDLLTKADLASAPSFSEDSVDFSKVFKYKYGLLKLAFERFLESKAKGLDTFEAEHQHWLDDYAFFTALQQLQKGTPWLEWQSALRRRDPNALKETRRNLEGHIHFHKFVQFQFFRQWKRLKTYAVQNGIGIIGDLPIFVSLDSADVWAHPEIFRLGSNGQPSVVAGVPPDMFSKTGQRWGNPLYEWDVLKEQGYTWWIRRFQLLFKLFDVVRLDHFIGFHRFWEIPANEKTATKGRYVPGPGIEFFDVILKELPKASFIAEDLGVVIPEVTELRKHFHFPGMSVLQFAFSGDPEKNPYLPSKLEAENVVYTGTHDNDTSEGWYGGDATPEEKAALTQTLGHPITVAHQDLTQLAFKSAAQTAIIPMQDILGLGSEARMNFPGKLDGNWHWRMGPGLLTGRVAKNLQDLSKSCSRNKDS